MGESSFRRAQRSKDIEPLYLDAFERLRRLPLPLPQIAHPDQIEQWMNQVPPPTHTHTTARKRPFEDNPNKSNVQRKRTRRDAICATEVEDQENTEASVQKMDLAKEFGRSNTDAEAGRPPPRELRARPGQQSSRRQRLPAHEDSVDSASQAKTTQSLRMRQGNEETLQTPYTPTASASQAKSRQGSPPKQNKKTSRPGPDLLPLGLDGPHIAGPIAERALSSASQKLSSVSTSRPSSPSKRSGKAASGVISADQLVHMNPAVSFETYSAAKEMAILTPNVRWLWTQYIAPVLSSPSFIPNALREQVTSLWDTPEKSKPVPPMQAYGTRIDYSTEDAALIWSTTEDVFRMANEYRQRTHEPHWAEVVISPILHLIRRLGHFKDLSTTYGSTLEAINVSSIEISPSSLCPYADDPALFKDLDRKVDYCMGIKLDKKDRLKLQRGVYAEGSGQPSINQCSNFVNFVPIFLNIEVKRRDVAKDPLVQLAAWIAAEFNKRRLESYPIDMPVLAIAITGDVWELYIVFQAAAEGLGTVMLYFLGPTPIGSTASQEGIFRIVEFLCAMGDWGNECFRPWFDEYILSLYEK